MKQNAILILLVALVAYDIWSRTKKKQTTKVQQETQLIPYPVAVQSSVPPPPYRPYNNSRTFSQVGILTDPTGTSSDILPLFGRLAPGCSTRYQYYTRTSGYQATQVQVHYGGRNCMEGYCSSCEEIYDGTTGITVDGYPGINFSANIYQIP